MTIKALRRQACLLCDGGALSGLLVAGLRQDRDAIFLVFCWTELSRYAHVRAGGTWACKLKQ
jgi:hypothetical protein